MLNFLKKLLGSKPNLKDLVEKGAQIIDVRTPAEFANGNINISKNIPLQELKQKLGTINKDKPVITVCASGIRSTSAKVILEQNGFAEVYNGGGWQKLQKKIYE